MKWCSRICLDFNASDPAMHIKVFQEAFECFCCCVNNVENRINLAEIVAVHLHLTRAKVLPYTSIILNIELYTDYRPFLFTMISVIIVLLLL